MDGFGRARLEVEFGVKQPIELVQLTLALQGIARDYRRFTNDAFKNDGIKVSDDDIQLYVTEVRSGSVIAELASAAKVMGAFLPLIDVQSAFCNYVTFFGETVDYFRALAKKPDVKAEDIRATKAAAQAMSDIMAVAANNPGGSFKLAAKVAAEDADGSKIALQVTISSDEAAEAQRGALIAQKLPTTGGTPITRMSCFISSERALDSPKSGGRTDDKALINSISPKPLPVHFASQLDQARINDMKADPNQNPFKSAFRVDVNVETDRNRTPKFYRVLHIHEVIADEDDAE